MRLIDADALIDAMTGACNIFDAHGVDTTISRALITIAGQAPTIETEPVRHGHWILPDICYEDIECSVCYADMPLPVSFDYRPTYKYCPMCGAKMDEVAK